MRYPRFYLILFILLHAFLLRSQNSILSFGPNWSSWFTTAENYQSYSSKSQTGFSISLGLDSLNFIGARDEIGLKFSFKNNQFSYDSGVSNITVMSELTSKLYVLEAYWLPLSFRLFDNLSLKIGGQLSYLINKELAGFRTTTGGIIFTSNTTDISTMPEYLRDLNFTALFQLNYKVLLKNGLNVRFNYGVGLNFIADINEVTFGTERLTTQYLQVGFIRSFKP